MSAVEARRSGAGVDRAGAGDLLQRRHRPSPAEAQVGAILLIDRDLSLAAVSAALADRVPAAPRLRRRLLATPPGCGRPVWVDDPRFDVTRHVTEASCPAPGDERALLDLAATFVTAPLPADRPQWAVRLVHGLAGSRSALVVVFDHVLADGVGGLAVLASLVDGSPRPSMTPFPQPPPAPRHLAVEAARSRAGALRRLPVALRSIAAGLVQLRPVLGGRAPATTLNRPTGARRRLAAAGGDLAALRATGHAHGGTVNDVLLAAVAGALHSVLLDRGERHDQLVLSVLVSRHQPGEADPVRNRVGALPVLLPASGERASRLDEVARRTPAAKSAARGGATTALEPLAAVLGRLGIMRWYVNRQRRVNAFTTNLAGPPAPLELLGAPVIEVLPVGAVAGNVAVAFAALSYAGALAVTVVADPDVCPEVDALAMALQRELDAYAEAADNEAVDGGR